MIPYAQEIRPDASTCAGKSRYLIFLIILCRAHEVYLIVALEKGVHHLRA